MVKFFLGVSFGVGTQYFSAERKNWKKDTYTLLQIYKVVRILKKRAREMSHSGKVSRTFEFLRVFGAAEKIQAKF